jgi:PAS domain S-box-containing protein
MRQKKRNTSLQIRLASLMILGLLIILATVAFLSGRQVESESELIAKDAVPGTIYAHSMRLAMSRSIRWVLVAASAQTAEFRDSCLKSMHEADALFADALKNYEATLRLHPEKDRALLERVKNDFAAFRTRRAAYEALILAGNRDASAAYLEHELVPALTPATQSVEELLKYNHENSISLASSISHRVHQLHWVVGVVIVLAFASAVVLMFNLTVRRRELAEVQEDEEKYSKAFQANPSGIAITEIETGRYLEVNESFCRILGFAPHEVIGRTSLELGIWENTEDRARLFKPLFDGKPLRDMEMNALTRDGSRRAVNVNAEVVELDGQKCVVSLIADITERKELLRQQVELAAIVESSEDAIIGKTLEGIITSWNRGAEKIFGYTAAEAIGQPLLILLPPERRHEEAEILARIARGETVQHFETVRVCKDGRKIFISATISPLKDSDGKVIGASKIARDITAQKQADEALRESEAHIRALGDNLPRGMMYQLDMGKDGSERRFIYVSAGVEKLHELTAGEVLQDAQLLYRQVVEADRPLVVAREAEALAEMKPFMAELRMKLPSGAVRWSLFTSAPRRAANGHVLWDGIELDISAQKEAEEVLREKQAQLVLAMGIAKLAHWEFDVESNTVTADAHLFHLLGSAAEGEQRLSMSPEDYIQKFVHPEDAGLVAGEVASGIATTDPHFARQFEHRIIRRDGTERVMLVRCRIHQDGKGRTLKFLGTNQDITEQKQAELRIRHLNRVYEVLSDINKTIVREKDPYTMLQEACRVVVEKGGFRMAWVGMYDSASHQLKPAASAGVVDGFTDLINMDLHERESGGGPSGQCFRTGGLVTFSDIEHAPFPELLRDEALKRGYRSSACFPLRVEGVVRGVFSLYSGKAGFFDAEELRLLDELAQDIGFALEVSEGESRRRQAEQELRWRTAFFEAQVHSAIDGIQVVDSEGKKLLQNRRMTELWKIPQPIAEDPDASPQLQYVLGRVKEPEVFMQKISYLNAHPDESSTDVIEQVDGTTLERHSAPVRGRDGTYYGRVWTFHDLTERRKLEAQFLRAQRMESIGTLASGVAHDLNNILTPIMMSVAVLRMKIPEAMREGLFDTIESSAARGAQIVKQVLTFGRGVEGERHPLQVGLLIQEMEQMIRSTFPKNIAVGTVNEANLWPVLGDATQLHQVLLNLCVNARDAMPDGGRLQLSAANLDIDTSYASMLPEISPGPHVLLEVSDTGSGIPPEIVDRIFDPFFTTKGVGKGTGLGLSTVHGIVKGHGGLLKVSSSPGHGTTFQIYLPAVPDHEVMAGADSLTPPPAGHGELVLVVDDEPAITNAARTVLEANGYRVLVAHDGAAALAEVSQHMQDIALVLTDFMMPVMDGALLVRTLRKMSLNIPVIGSTGLAEKTHLDELRALNTEAILRKPYNAGMLLRTMDGVLHPRTAEPKPLP